MNHKRVPLIAAMALLLAGCQPKDQKNENTFQVPVVYYKLPNGLRVTLSEDHTAPTVVVAVYYNIGFRIEPKGRTGFAHLFEHMMFEGSKNVPKGDFDKLTERNGGFNNGSTRFDFTNYYEVMPANMLEPVLWAEADRMKGLDITQENLTNQQGVVVNEVKVNVLNQPYGGFPWLDMPQYANDNWFNAHNFYGDVDEIEAANLADVKSFFNTYYAPSNAALTITGDFNPEQAKTWIKKYFENIPSGPQPQRPDISEPEQKEGRHAVKPDSLAQRPALAVAYKMPERNTPEYFAMGLIDQMLVQGNDSKLYQLLVQDKGYTGQLEGGINYLGNMFNYDGPMLWMADLTYDNAVPEDSIVNQFDRAVDWLEKGVTQDELDLALVKMRSSLYDIVGSNFGIGRADLLSSFALFDDDPSRINTLEQSFRQVTPDLIRKTAQEFLRPSNRTILIDQPKSQSK